MKVFFFGRLKEALGEVLEVPDQPAEKVGDLRRRLAECHPAAAHDLLSPRVRACVDDVIVGEDYALARQARVEFFPPLSGG